MSRRPRKLASLIGAAALVAGGLLALTPTSSGALTQIVVANNADAGAGSLRQALIDASAGGPAAGDDVEIVIPASVGDITLTTGQLSYDGGGTGAHSLTLRGSGTTITQDSANARVIDITSNNTSTFTLDGLVLTGAVTTNFGGAISAQQGATVVVTSSTLVGNTSEGGGAIYMTGNLQINNSTISGNDGGANAGAAYAVGTMTITGSTMIGNQATVGGALFTEGPATITNSTFTGNIAGDGGAVFVKGQLTLVYATIVENVAGQGANLQFSPTNDTVLTSFGSVIARPVFSTVSCYDVDSVISLGYNFDDADTCGFGSGPGDQTNGGDPLLGALAGNGGPTETMAPQTGSALIDKIPASSPCGGVDITVDQRGLPRPVTAGRFCDIGAYEIQVPDPIEVVIRFTG